MSTSLTAANVLTLSVSSRGGNAVDRSYGLPDIRYSKAHAAAGVFFALRHLVPTTYYTL